MGVMETFLIALFGTFIANMASGWIFFKLAAGAEKNSNKTIIQHQFTIILRKPLKKRFLMGI